MPARSKRARSSAADLQAVSHSTATTLRAALAARCGDDSPPGAWRAAAAAAGDCGADAFLCHLGRSVAAALESVPVNAEAARAQLLSTRDVLHSAVDSRCDELEVRINDAESTKIATLERELCAVDAILEKLLAERGAAAEAAASLDDGVIVARNAELTVRLDAAEVQLLALPTSVVEPPHVGLVIDEPALLAGIAAFRRVVAPQAFTAADVALEGAPTYVRPGCSLAILFALAGAQLASQSAKELQVSLGAAAAAAHVEASLTTESAVSQPLVANASLDATGRFVTVTIFVPLDAPAGSSVCCGPLTVSGQPVAGLPVVLRVEPPGPSDLSPEHAAWLQSQLPPGGSSSPGAWEEVYRATSHGFGAAAFHERCDGRVRLLVLVRAQEGGWLFGGFTAVGFIRGPTPYYADPSAFVFSLTNSLGHPEKLESTWTGTDIYYSPYYSACFCTDLIIRGNADTMAGSETYMGDAYAVSVSTGAYPMAQGMQQDWLAAEVVAWVV